MVATPRDSEPRCYLFEPGPTMGSTAAPSSRSCSDASSDVGDVSARARDGVEAWALLDTLQRSRIRGTDSRVSLVIAHGAYAPMVNPCFDSRDSRAISRP